MWMVGKRCHETCERGPSAGLLGPRFCVWCNAAASPRRWVMLPCAIVSGRTATRSLMRRGPSDVLRRLPSCTINPSVSPPPTE